MSIWICDCAQQRLVYLLFFFFFSCPLSNKKGITSTVKHTLPSHSSPSPPPSSSPSPFPLSALPLSIISCCAQCESRPGVHLVQEQHLYSTISTISILLFQHIQVLTPLHIYYFQPSSSTPRNARVKRVLKNREAKTEENIKTAIFIRGSQTSQIVNDALADLVRLSLSWIFLAFSSMCFSNSMLRTYSPNHSIDIDIYSSFFLIVHVEEASCR